MKHVLGTNEHFTISKNGTDTNVDEQLSKCTEITYADLVTLRNNSGLVAGMWYRITDYVTTTVQANTQSAGHAFDVLVRADSANILNENAFAALHSGDTYFANSKINSWELKYCLDNDTNRFNWADSTNGKGVIFYMKDENDNECPYDFKNIQFKWTDAIEASGIVANVFYYTFSVATGTNDATVTDHSRNGIYCYGNKMGKYIYGNKQKLNANVFRNMSTISNCYSNTFGNVCYSNTFGYSCSNNTFGCLCYHNTFGNNCSSNTFGDGCNNNFFRDDCNSNTFGNECQYNTFGNACYLNTFGNNCQRNTFGNNCQCNTFGGDCSFNAFGNFCSKNTFGNNCENNLFGNGDDGRKNYYKCIIVENGVSEIILDRSNGNNEDGYVQNIRICQGLSNQTIVIESFNNNYQTVYKHTRSSEVILGYSELPTTGLCLWFDDFDMDGYEDKNEMAEGYGFEDWVDLSSQYVDDPDELGANKYAYTGQTIEYDGDTYYLWVMQNNGEGYSEEIEYMITDTVDFDTLYDNSLEADPSNEYTPYVALLSDDMGEYRQNGDRPDWLIKVVNNE